MISLTNLRVSLTNDIYIYIYSYIYTYIYIYDISYTYHIIPLCALDNVSMTSLDGLFLHFITNITNACAFARISSFGLPAPSTPYAHTNSFITRTANIGITVKTSSDVTISTYFREELSTSRGRDGRNGRE
eukprot:Tbor_TRINITY_DN5306_c2_g1::TRINITY_DN5306_c2_g1_i2::g.4367::m.4367